MELKLKISRRSFKAENGEERAYYSYIAELDGVEIKFKPDDKDKKLITHLLDGYNLPIEENIGSELELMRRFLAGDSLSGAETAVLNKLLVSKGLKEE